MNKENLALISDFLATLWQASSIHTIFTILILVTKNIFYALQFWSLIRLVDMVISFMNRSSSLTDLQQHVFLLLIFMLTHQLLQLISAYTLKVLQENGTKLIQTRLINSVALVPLHLKETPKYKELLIDAEQAIELNETMFFSNFIKLVDLVMELICFLVLLGVIHWIIGILAFQIIGASLILEIKILNTSTLLKNVGIEEQRKADYIMDLATNKQGSLEIRFYGLACYLSDQWSNLINKVTAKLTKATITKGIWNRSWQDYLLLLAWFLVLLGTVSLLQLKLISLGAFIIVLHLVSRLGGAVKNGSDCFSWITTYLNRYFASLWSILKAGNSARNIFGDGLFLPNAKDELLTTPINKIEFHDVYFNYPDHTIGVRQASVTIKKGEIVALVGPNGAGKSTFIKLLLGIYFPDKGKITVDSHPLNKNNVYNWWGRISVVFQDYARFGLTIRESIGFNQLKEKEIWAALDKVGLGELVRNLPAGLDTVLGDTIGGYQPSGGQWQRFALARAFAKNGDLVIFDEPSASLDVFAEEQVFQEFRRFCQGKTGIFVSHRLGPTKLADKIIVFQAGKIVEVGSHQQLITAGGLYAKMYAIQADGYT